VKPSRPPVEFPSYKSESSATAVEESPWFEQAGVPASEPKPAAPKTAVREPIPARIPTSKAPLSPRVPASPKSTAPVKSEPLKLPAPRPVTKSVPVPVPVPVLAPVSLAPITVPAPPAFVIEAQQAVVDLITIRDRAATSIPAPAPAWPLPAVPTVAAPVPERQELPSFGPVAFDLDATQAERPSETRLRAPSRRSQLLVAAVAMFATLGFVGGRAAMSAGARDSIAPVTAAAPERATEIVAPAPPPQAQAPGRRLTPEEIFPAQAPAPIKEYKTSKLEYRHARAVIAADLARRNAPAVVPTLPKQSANGFRPAPSLDDLVRSPRLRGEHD
jgi:hypothetical protein